MNTGRVTREANVLSLRSIFNVSFFAHRAKFFDYYINIFFFFHLFVYLMRETEMWLMGTILDGK